LPSHQQPEARSVSRRLPVGRSCSRPTTCRPLRAHRTGQHRDAHRAGSISQRPCSTAHHHSHCAGLRNR
jgi:hypothetical protein